MSATLLPSQKMSKVCDSFAQTKTDRRTDKPVIHILYAFGSSKNAAADDLCGQHA